MAQTVKKRTGNQLARRTGSSDRRRSSPRGPNAVDMLQDDHDRVKKLFADFGQGDEQTQAALAEHLFNDLDLHAQLEEQVFYPVFASIGQDAADTVAVSIQEHQVVKDLIREMRGIRVTDPRFNERFDALRENVLDHATEEEETVFPAARLNLDLYDVGRRMALLKGAGGALQSVRSISGLIRRYPAQALLIGASILVLLAQSRRSRR